MSFQKTRMFITIFFQKLPSRGVFKKTYSENVQPIYRKTPKSKCDFNKITLQFYWNHTSAWVFTCIFQISCIFSEHLFLRAAMEGCFCFFLAELTFTTTSFFKKNVERTVHIEKNCYLNSFWKYFEYLMCGILWLKYKRYHWKTRPSGRILWISLKCLYRQKQPPEVFYQKRRWS